MEVEVPRVDSPDPVLAHEDRDVRVVQQLPGDVGKLPEDLLRDGGVTRRCDEH